MNDHNLDDLIIGEPDSGGGRSKSILSLIALILIILIIAVLFAKLIFSEPEALEETGTAELTGYVKPEQRTGNLPKARPVEKIPDELKPISDETLPKSDELKPVTIPRKPEVQRQPEIQPQKKPATEPVKPRPKPTELFAKKPTPKPVKKSKTKTGEKTNTGTKTYYIQVGSFKRMPDKRFLEKIKANGYEPILFKTGQMIKVRVGPYPSYAEAKAKLPEIKDQIGVDGFVVRKK